MDDFNSLDLSSTDDNLSKLYKDRMEGGNNNMGSPDSSNSNTGLSPAAPWWVQVNELGKGPTLEEMLKNIPKSRRGHASTVFRISSDKGLFQDEDDKEFMIVTGGFTDEDWKTFPVWALDISSAEKFGNGIWVNLTPTLGLSEESDPTCRVDYWDNHSATANSTTTNSSSSSSSSNPDSWEAAVPCSPSSRMGHLSVQYNDYLYVFGGLLYDRHSGVFFQPKATHVYRLPLLQFFNNSSSSTPYQWQRITPQVQSIPKALSTSCNKNWTPEEVVVRGEFKGGLWESESKLIVFGGLRVEDIHLSLTKTLQLDTTLGDVWAYDFNFNSWELLFPSPCTLPLNNHSSISISQPLNRTAHAATVVGDELIVYGGMTNDKTPRLGQTNWIELDDIWIFHLKSKSWSKRTMYPSIPRCYHSIVAWKNDSDTILASFGGYRTVTDTLTNQPMTYVFDETYLSFPPSSQHPNSLNYWFRVNAPLSFESHSMVSNRYEHSAVISQNGWMYVWGGRFQYTSTITGLWALHVTGNNLQLVFAQAFDSSGYDDAVTRFYVVVTTLMFLSMGLSYVFGRAGGRLLAANTEDGTGASGGRGGIPQDVIDTLPIKKYSHNEVVQRSREAASGRGTVNHTTPQDDSFENERYDDDCCPICLVEYVDGEEIRSLPCGHGFHKICVDPWLLSSPSCPFCRDSLRDLEFTSRIASIPSNLVIQRVRNIFSGLRNESSPSTDPTQETADGRINSPTSAESQTEEGLSEGPVGRVGGRDSLENFIRRMRSMRRNRNRPHPIGGNSLYSSTLELSESGSGLPPINGRARHLRMNLDDGSERRHRRPRSRNNSGESLSPLNDPLRDPHDTQPAIV